MVVPGKRPSLALDSPLAMVVESIDALVAIATMTTAFVHMKLAEEAESLVGRRPRCSFPLRTSKRTHSVLRPREINF